MSNSPTPSEQLEATFFRLKKLDVEISAKSEELATLKYEKLNLMAVLKKVFVGMESASGGSVATPKKRLAPILVPALVEAGPKGVNFKEFAQKHSLNQDSMTQWYYGAAKNLIERVGEGTGIYRAIIGKENALEALLEKKSKKAVKKTPTKKGK